MNMFNSDVANPSLPRSVMWDNRTLKLLDQASLQFPYHLRYIEATAPETVARAIQEMNVRGAPAIGLAGGYALALAALRSSTNVSVVFSAEMKQIGDILKGTRPTAVNLGNVIDRILRILDPMREVVQQKNHILEEIIKIHQEEEKTYQILSQRGAELLSEHARVLTHCNTGALATGTSYGTALGIIQVAHQAGKIDHVYATETRPRFQGLKITAWELQQLQIPFTLLVEGAVGYLLAKEQLAAILVGADRILTQEDPPYVVLNKIGTLSLAILAQYFEIPFIVAAPYSSFDQQKTLDQIQIELRDPKEITHFQDHPIAPTHTPAINPAFDITPPDLITAIVTEKEIIYPNA